MHQGDHLVHRLAQGLVTSKLADQGHHVPIHQERVPVGRIDARRGEAGADAGEALVGDRGEKEVVRGGACHGRKVMREADAGL